MSLLGGFMQGSAGASSFYGKQDLRRRADEQAAQALKLGEQQLKIGEQTLETGQQTLEKGELDAAKEANNNVIRGYQAQGVLDPNDPTMFDVGTLRSQIEQGDKTSTKLLLDTATASGRLPEGSVAESLTPLPGGGYAVKVRNADGSTGAVTTDGTSEAGSVVVNFDPGRLANLASQTYRTKVLPNQSMFDLSSLRAQQNRVRQDAEGVDLAAELTEAQSRLNAFENESNVTTAIENAGGENASRAFADIVANASETERGEIIAAAAKDTGTELLPTKGAPEGEMGRKRSGRTGRTPVARPTPSTPEGTVRGRGQRKFGSNETIGLSESAPPEVAAEADNIAEATAEDTGAEVAKKVEDGSIRVSSELESATRRILIENDIERLQDLIRLNNKERALARAVIIASSPDAATRQAMSEAIDNILETGSSSMSRQDQIVNRQTDEQIGIKGEQLAINQSKLEKDWAELNRLYRTDSQGTADAAVKFQKDTSKLFFGEDGTESNFDAETARSYANSIFGPENVGLLNRINTNRDKTIVFGALNMGASLTIAALAAEEEGGVKESLLSFFRPDVEDVVDGGDFDLSRVTVEYETITGDDGTSKKVPKAFRYLTADGDTADEQVTASTLQKVSPAIFKTVLAAAKLNERLAAKKATGS